jgi:hypothetical protein
MSERAPGSPPPIDHEIDARTIGKIGVWLTAITVAGFLVGWGVYLLLLRGERQLDRPPSPIAEARAERPVPGPPLQQTPELDLAGLRRAEEEWLHSWGWVDRGAGVARVPVEVALERVAADGRLPDFTVPLEISTP